MRGQLHAVIFVMAAGIPRAAKNASRERIGEVHVVLRMFDTVHQRDIGLAGEHHRQRHAEDGDRPSERDVSAEAQLDLAPGGAKSNTAESRG